MNDTQNGWDSPTGLYTTRPKSSEKTLQQTRIHSPSETHYLFSEPNTSTLQDINVVPAVFHKTTDQAIVTENYGCHFGDVLVTLVFRDVSSVIHQAGQHITIPKRFICALSDLLRYTQVENRPLCYLAFVENFHCI